MMGGMGVVYFALDHGDDGRPVALKTFRPEFLPDRAARDRFLREGTAWVELGSHPHIVRCYKVEYIDPTAFLVLELIAKEQNMPDASLRSWLIPGHPLPTEQALSFALQIARGMQYATGKIPGFVHRDLKPENILVGVDKLPATNINRLRVTDFGLVKTIASGDISAMTGSVEELKPNQVQFTRGVGTPLYMAPEQWRGEKVGVFTDVYAFGCILYEMLTGSNAAVGGTSLELQASHCDGRLRALPLDLPKDVAELATRCLTLNPALRYGAWDEVTNDLKKAFLVLTGQHEIQSDISMGLSLEEWVQLGWSLDVIGRAYLDLGKTEVAIDYFERALSISHKNGNRKGEVVAFNHLGNAHEELGNAPRAINYYEQALALSRETGDQSSQGDILGNLGNAYSDFGDVRLAIRYYEQCISVYREIGNRVGEGIALGNLGNAYLNLGEARPAIKYYEQRMEILRETGDRRGEGNLLGNLGNAYAILGNIQRAVWFYEKQIEIAREIGDRRREGVGLGNLGIVYKNLGDVYRSIKYYGQALVIMHEIGDTKGVAINAFNMAVLYAQQGDSARALPLAREAAQIWAEIGSSNLQHAQQLIVQLHASQK
ncbi:MAG TPA: serine/threonine-protein kinase [Anaerolineales bacterium]|nr:serine/threonine-protein kinase [Anaerolineales bacterium]